MLRSKGRNVHVYIYAQRQECLQNGHTQSSG